MTMVSEEKKIFRYTHPLIQWKTDIHHEYHITAKVNNRFLQSFKENTQKYFLGEVFEFIKDTFALHRQSIGMDSYYNEYGRQQYIWVHVPAKNAINDILAIIDKLHDKYYADWSHHNVPKLITLIKNQLQFDREYLASSVSHYQLNNGFDATQNAIDTAFRDVKLSRHNLSYEDMESDSE